MNSVETRNRSIDGLRGIAISLVLFWHFVVNQIGQNTDNLSRALYQYGSATWCGVDLFFVISGFLITGILIDNRDKKNLIYKFYVKRALRILPLYLILVISYIIVKIFDISWSPYLFGVNFNSLYYLTFTQNFYSAHVGNLGPNWLSATWSLAVEEQFYLLAPLFFWYFSQKKIFIILLFLLISAPVFRMFNEPVAAYVYPFCRSDAIASGAIAALLVRTNLWHNLSWKVSILCSLYIIFLFFSLIGVVNVSQTGGVLNHFLFAIIFSYTIMVCQNETNIYFNFILHNFYLRKMGVYCFFIYLIHIPFSSIIQEIFLVNPYNISGVFDFLLNIIITITIFAMAHLSFKYFEGFFLKISKKIVY